MNTLKTNSPPADRITFSVLAASTPNSNRCLTDQNSPAPPLSKRKRGQLQCVPPSLGSINDIGSFEGRVSYNACFSGFETSARGRVTCGRTWCVNVPRRTREGRVRRAALRRQRQRHHCFSGSTDPSAPRVALGFAVEDPHPRIMRRANIALCILRCR